MYKPLFKKYAGFAVFFLLGISIFLLHPFSQQLNIQAQQVLGILCITIGIWVTKPFGLSFSLGGCFLAGCLLALGIQPSIVFSGFTQSALWTLIPALFFGFVLQKTGLGKRIALTIIRIFPANYAAITAAWVLIGILLSILTPSITVRVAIVIPIAVYCSQLFGLQPGSKGNSLILLSAFSMALLPGTGWLNGSLWGSIIQGFFQSVNELEHMLTFSTWMKTVFLPMEITSLALILIGYYTLKPEEKIPKNAVSKLKENKQAPIRKEEKYAAIILILVFLLFTTNSIHKIPDAAICLAAVTALFACGALKGNDFNQGISWDLVIFIGFALGLGSLFSYTGISEWLSGILIPILKPLSANPVLFVFLVTIVLFLWRFIDVAILIPTMAILTPALPAISDACHINPLIWVTIYIMVGNSFFLPYQNMWALMSQSIAQDFSWTGKDLTKYGFLYFFSCMIALAITIPYWIYLNLL